MWDKAEKFLAKDKYIGPLIKKYGHCKIKPRIHVDYFQALISDIIGQQLSGRVANVIEGRLKAKIKGRLTPEKVLTLPDQKLRECGMAWAKVRSIKDLATRVEKRLLHIRSLNKLPDEEVMKELISVKGIGPWTAEMFLMFSLGRGDVFPVDDLGIRNGMMKLLAAEPPKNRPSRRVRIEPKSREVRSGGGKLLKKDLKPLEMARFAERWKPYRTVASWYIWSLLDEK